LFQLEPCCSLLPGSVPDLNGYITAPFHYRQVFLLYLGSRLISQVAQNQLLADQRFEEPFGRLAVRRRGDKENKKNEATNMQGCPMPQAFCDGRAAKLERSWHGQDYIYPTFQPRAGLLPPYIIVSGSAPNIRTRV
jgi:hypothetical protein